MKLPSRSDLVKPDRFVLTVAAVSTTATLLAVVLVLALTDPQAARMDRFGAAAARAFAELAVEPLMRQDRLHLGVIGNRFAEAPEIDAVATYTSNDELLTATGEVAEPSYAHPVLLDQAVVGYVRVALDPAAFAEPVGARALGLVLAALLVPWLVGCGWTFARAARSGELRRQLARAKPAEPADRPTEASDAPSAPPPAVAHYLLAVNLYNQLSLQPSERDFERRLALELAEAVAGQCHGQVQCLPGVGVLVDFDHREDPERPFQVICAALLLARLLRDEAPFGSYRLGLNLALQPAGAALPADDPAVGDATLLSALAPDDTLAISATVAELLENETRYAAKRLDNPLLDELATSRGRCYLVIGVAPPFDVLIGQQAERIKGQRDAISSPSTF